MVNILVSEWVVLPGYLLHGWTGKCFEKTHVS